MKMYFIVSEMPLVPMNFVSQIIGEPPPKYGIQVQADEVSDEYHTMSELYKHRYVLFIALCKIYDNYITPLGSRVRCWKSKLHSDGTMLEDSFILGMNITSFRDGYKQVTYHLPMSYWRQIDVMIYERAPDYDGHTSDDVLERLMEL